MESYRAGTRVQSEFHHRSAGIGINSVSSGSGGLNFLFWRAWIHRNNHHFDQIPISDTYRLVLNLHEALLIYPHYSRALFALVDYIRLHGMPAELKTHPLSLIHTLEPFPRDLLRAASLEPEWLFFFRRPRQARRTRPHVPHPPLLPPRVP